MDVTTVRPTHRMPLISRERATTSSLLYSITKPLRFNKAMRLLPAILLLLPLHVSAGEGPDWKKMGECSARYALTLEIIRSFSIDMLAVELAEEIDTPEDAFLAGVEYALEKQSVLHSYQMMLVDMDAEVVKKLNLQELLHLSCHEYLPNDD